MSINLPKMLAPSQGLALRQGVVTGTPDTVNLTCSVFIAGNDTAVTLKYMHHVFPVSGDPVWIMQNGTDMLVVGKTKPGGNVSVGGWFKANRTDGTLVTLSTDGGGAVDIAGWLDFHEGRAADEATNYNIRLENVSVPGVLQLLGGRFRVGLAEIGTSPPHASYAWFGHNAMTGATQYGFLQDASGNTIVNSTSVVWIRRNGVANTNEIRLDASGVLISDDIAVPTDTGIWFKGAWDGTHRIHHSAADDGFRYSTWNYHRFYMGGSEQFRLNVNYGSLIYNGWYRCTPAATLVYNETEACGLRAVAPWGATDGIETQHQETVILAYKHSQAGYATAGLQSVGTGSMVPYVTLHAVNSSACSWRKDAGQEYLVCIRAGGGCGTVFGDAHSICSERARKHNISIVDDYGLKTIRKLKPHRFQYKPTDEFEIWSYEMWKADRADGKWKYNTDESGGWDNWKIGYMAEEMMNLVPEVIGWHADGKPKGIDYGNLVVVAIAAINELAAKVEDLEARLERAHARAA